MHKFKTLLIACALLFPISSYASPLDSIVKSCSDKDYVRDNATVCMSFFENVNIQDINQDPMIHACADSVYAEYNGEVCEAYFKSLRHHDTELEKLHKQLKACSITDKACFTNVVIKMRNLD